MYVIGFAMAAMTVSGGIGAALCRWKRKILALHTANEEEQGLSGTVFTRVSFLAPGL